MRGKIQSYVSDVDTGTLRNVETGEKIQFSQADISGSSRANLLVGRVVDYTKSGDGKVAITARIPEIHDQTVDARVSKVRFSGYYSLNDAFAGFLANILWILHFIVALVLLINTVQGDFYATFGIETFSGRLKLSLVILVNYTVIIGVLATFVAINEHLREINRRQS
jgi:hypothetical protein